MELIRILKRLSAIEPDKHVYEEGLIVHVTPSCQYSCCLGENYTLQFYSNISNTDVAIRRNNITYERDKTY